MPEISVITAAYIDTEEKRGWLQEAIQSVLAQSFQDWEMIVVDDNSPVDLSPIHTGDERVRWLKAASRQGPATVRNTAVALARAEALVALDADDQLMPNTLQAMYTAWSVDRKRIVYGDLQRLERGPDQQFRLGMKFDLPEYNFERVMDPRGIIPVTAMHSKTCHEKAGGWKPDLEAGLEDIEKWIAAGKAGFCGFRVPEVTLLYRQHTGSRAFALRRINRRESEMRDKIREMHRDIYEGRFPMGCCGRGRSSNSGSVPPAPVRVQAFSISPSTLDQVATNEKVWVEYVGGRGASFGVVGQATGIHYEVAGTGHKLEVHVHDLPKFRRSGRGLDFRVGVAAPDGSQSPTGSGTDVTAPAAEAYTGPAPKLATLERLDRVAADRQAA